MSNVMTAFREHRDLRSSSGGRTWGRAADSRWKMTNRMSGGLAVSTRTGPPVTA